eukprot:3012166-Rhodomonas_salina.1
MPGMPTHCIARCPSARLRAHRAVSPSRATHCSLCLVLTGRIGVGGFQAATTPAYAGLVCASGFPGRGG